MCDFCQTASLQSDTVSSDHEVASSRAPIKCLNCRKIYLPSDVASSRSYEDKKFQCEKCGKVFKTMYGLNYHGTHSHGIKSRSNLSPVQCTICNKNIRDKYSLKTHLKIVHGDKIVKCMLESCTKMFSTESCMMDHYRRHLGQKIFKCEHCSQSFQNKSNYKNHVKGVHLEIKSYNCNLCEQKFVCQSYLTQHIKRKHFLHKNKFFCEAENCNKQFTTKNDYTNHLNIHMGVKPFLCSVCGYSAAYKGNLRSHLKTHEKRKKYRCTKCNRDFYNAASQQRCIRRHQDSTSMRSGELVEIVPSLVLPLYSTTQSSKSHNELSSHDLHHSNTIEMSCPAKNNLENLVLPCADKSEPPIFSPIADMALLPHCTSPSEEASSLRSTDPFQDLNFLIGDESDYTNGLPQLMCEDVSINTNCKESVTKDANVPVTLDCVQCSQLTDISLLIEHLDSDHQGEM